MAGLRILTAIQIMVALAIAGIEALPRNPLPEMNLMHRVVLDQRGDYIMLWTPRDNDIVFEVQVATCGYVGLGFSPNGGMRNSDIILGWVDDNDGKVFLHDRFASAYAVPRIDKSQDVELLGGYQNATHTILRFTRPWKTCDPDEDREISDDTVRMIWSYGVEDPQDEMRMKKHIQRGTKNLYLREPQFTLPKFGNDVQTWELFSPNVSLPDDLTTLYWCKLFKIPPLPRKTHIIGYVPVIADDNLQHVHHILVYECHLPDSARHFEKWLDVKGAQCKGPNMPLSWRFCNSPIIGWAVGGEGTIFPEHIGFPLGEEHGGANYFMSETHYDNPNLRKGVADSSGVRIFHTEKLRQYDGGLLEVGHRVYPTQMIPPGENWLTIGHCSGECTQNTLSPNGIRVFAGLLHTHLLGAKVTVRHIRNNKELPILLKDLNYDFNFQQVRDLKDEVTFLPGDSFITECGLDSTKRRVPTFGGFGTQEEMCLSFLSYYPRADLAICTSHPKVENMHRVLGIKEIYKGKQGPSGGNGDGNGIDEEAETQLANSLKTGDADSKLGEIELAQLFRKVIIKEPLEYRNQSFYDIVTSDETWKDKEVIKKLQDVIVNGDHRAHCIPKSDIRKYIKDPEIISYPQFIPLPSPVEICTKGNQDSSLKRVQGSQRNPWKPLVCPPYLPCTLYRSPN